MLTFAAAEGGALLYAAVDMFAFVAAERRRSSVLFCCPADMFAFAAAEARRSPVGFCCPVDMLAFVASLVTQPVFRVEVADNVATTDSPRLVKTTLVGCQVRGAQ